MGPLLLEGYGLQKKDGHLAICMHAYSVSSIPESLGIVEWNYEMFEDGVMRCMTDDDVHHELGAGGRIIIVQS